MTLEQEQKPVIVAIVNELISIIPKTWTDVTLKLQIMNYPNGEEGYSHSITNPTGFRDLVEPSESLYEQTWSLKMIFQKYNQSWKTAMLSVHMTEDEDWEYEINFEY